MPEFDKFLQDLKEGMAQLAKDNFGKKNWQAALQDGQAFLEKSKADLQRWLKMLNNKEITQEEFKSLVEGLKDLAAMEALKQAGLKAAKIDKFRTQAINLLIDTAFKIIIPI
ncbi:MAG: hypothetical protein ACOZFS_13810 [Thermodesulfobacteriota bacterium]